MQRSQSSLWQWVRVGEREGTKLDDVDKIDSMPTCVVCYERINVNHANENGAPSREMECRIVVPNLKFVTVGKHLNEHFAKKCFLLERSNPAIRYLQPALDVLEMEMIVYPDEPNLPDEQQENYKIDFLPAYVMCHVFVRRMGGNAFIRDLHGMLLNDIKKRRGVTVPIEE